MTQTQSPPEQEVLARLAELGAATVVRGQRADRRIRRRPQTPRPDPHPRRPRRHPGPAARRQLVHPRGDARSRTRRRPGRRRQGLPGSRTLGDVLTCLRPGTRQPASSSTAPSATAATSSPAASRSSPAACPSKAPPRPYPAGQRARPASAGSPSNPATSSSATPTAWSGSPRTSSTTHSPSPKPARPRKPASATASAPGRTPWSCSGCRTPRR